MANQQPLKPQQNPLDGGTTVGLMKSTAERMAESTRYYERQFRGGGTRQAAGRSDACRWCMTVLTTGAGIAVATANGTPTSGSVQLCDWNGASWVGNGNFTTGWNHSTSNAIAPNKFVPAYYRGPILAVEDPC